MQTNHDELLTSAMTESLKGSEIIKLAGEIREKISNGKKIFNFTIGDFDPEIFPIPAELRDEIVRAYGNNLTNYPEANGMAALRKSIAAYSRTLLGLTYNENEILVSAGARPIIYSIYLALLDAGDTVVFPVPSWNNNHYCHLLNAHAVMVETTAENNFMPVASQLEPHLGQATLLSLCSPLNPTGTVFSRQQLEEICDLVLAVNASRKTGEKPLYVMYDQIYSALTYGDVRHYDPVSIRPEMKKYTIYVDGISKAFAATGVRVGWALGPQRIIDKMKNILNHVGAWSPKPEQMAVAAYLEKSETWERYLESFKTSVAQRLQGFYDLFRALKNEGFPVDAIQPQAAIYLTIKINLKGFRTPDGKILKTTRDTTSYILEEAGIAIVPFYAFGSNEESDWYRLSVGTCRLEDLRTVKENLHRALTSVVPVAVNS